MRSVRPDRTAATWVVAAVVLCCATSASGWVELGVDAGYERRSIDEQLGWNEDGHEVYFDGPVYTLWKLPVQRLRAGFLVVNGLAIEPGLSFQGNYNAGWETTALEISLDLVQNFGDVGQLGPFFVSWGTLVRYQHVSSDFFGGSGLTRVGLAGGLGYRLFAGDRLALRFQAGGNYVFEKKEPFHASEWALVVRAGLSFFTH